MDKITEVDIVIPCYNVEKTVKNCIEILMEQSFSSNQYHCFFINDASTDQTGEILEKYKNEKKITVIHHEKNSGLSSARNSGIEAGSSDFIAFLDGDMVPKRDWLMSFQSYFDKNIIAVMGDNVPPKNISLTPVEKYYFGNLRGARQYNDKEKIPLQYMLFGNAMIKREALVECGMFDEKIKKYGGEDTDLSARIWDLYPDSFVFSKKSDAIHYHRRGLKDFCHSMEVYGKHNLPLLVRRYPHHKMKFAADWIFSLKGYTIFNFIVRKVVFLIFKIYPSELFIRYLVAASVIRGARKSNKLISGEDRFFKYRYWKCR